MTYVREQRPALRIAGVVMVLANILAGCQIVSGLSQFKADRTADSGTAGAGARASAAVADTDAGPRAAHMPDAAHDDKRESQRSDAGIRTGAPSIDAAVGGAGGGSAEAEQPVAGQGGSAGSRSTTASAGSSGSNSTGAGGKGADAGAQIEIDSDERLGNTDLRVSDILGFYSGNWGQMILRKQGHEIIGVYEHRDGTLIGEIDDEGVFLGWWTQTPTRTGVDAGEVEFRWSKSVDGIAIALDGRWRYGTDGEWLENWDVARVTDRSPPSQLSDRFERPEDFKQRP